VAIARARTRARIMAVVKADAYGHGACTVAQAAVAAGAEWLGTTDIAEASEKRRASGDRFVQDDQGGPLVRSQHDTRGGRR
jgi:alanine racemase